MASAAQDRPVLALSSRAIKSVTTAAPVESAAPLELVSTRARAKWLAWRTARCLALMGAFYIAACLIGLTPVNSEFRQPAVGTEVFIYTDHLQSKILMPVESDNFNWHSSLRLEDFPQTNPEHDYVAFSWGDRDFSLNTPSWSDADGLRALQAVFLPSEAVMHVEFRQRPEEAAGYRKIVLDAHQQSMLANQIQSSFRLNDKRKLSVIEGASIGSHDAFFEANGTFYFLNTGNNWTGTCLKRAGVRTGMWTPFTIGVAQASG
jgi:uncharacterized protein (TIGR02117 family)